MNVVRRDEDGGIAIETQPAEHVCYFHGDDWTPKLERSLRSSRHVMGIQPEGEWVRTRWKKRDVLRALHDPRPNPKTGGKRGYFVEKKIPTYEADVDPVRRWLTDEEPKIARPRRCYLDIETDSRVPFSRKEEMRILCWAVVDEDGNEWTGVLREDTTNDERRLLRELWGVLDGFDQVLAWHGAGFDFPVIRARTEKAGIKVETRRWLWLDHLKLYKRMNITASESGDEKQSMKLEDIGQAVVGEGKTPGVDASKSWEMWERGGRVRRKLVRYCLNDTTLLREIEKRTGYADLLQSVCDATHCFPDTHGLAATNQVEGFLMVLGKSRGMHFPSHFVLEASESFKGAYVMPPAKTGILKNVHVADFKSLYPSIIQTWNISPETFDPNVTLVRNRPESLPTYLRSTVKEQRVPIPDGYCAAPLVDHAFKLEPRGILALALDEILRRRDKWKAERKKHAPGTRKWKEADRRATAYKQVANGFYGVVSSPLSRFFVRECGESVTQSGVWLITETAKEAEHNGMAVIYADTDSIFVQDATKAAFDSFVENCNDEIFPRLLEQWKCGTNTIRIAYEKAFERVIMIRKKRYAGRFSHYEGTPANEDSKPEVKGLEYKRGDSIRLGRRLQAIVVDLLLGGGIVRTKRIEKCEEDPEVFAALLDGFRDYVLNGEIDVRDFVQSKSLNRGLNGYKRSVKKKGKPLGVVAEIEGMSEGAYIVKVEDIEGEREERIKPSQIHEDSDVKRKGDRGTLLLRDWTSLPTHVEVARVLAERGQEVAEGVRVDYVVTKGDVTPMQAVPVDDVRSGKETPDRFYIWESLVYPPTQRVLECAFSSYDWRKWEKVRPAKTEAQVVKAKEKEAKVRRRRREILSGQGELFG